MQPYAVAFAPAAEDQLDALYRYIAEQAGDSRADAYVSGIIERCRSLQTFPRRGTKRDDIRPDLRTMGHARRVTIAFSVDKMRRRVSILGVFYGGQDVEMLLSGAQLSTEE